jgi:hypothetical protein
MYPLIVRRGCAASTDNAESEYIETGFVCGVKFASPIQTYPLSSGWPSLSENIGNGGEIDVDNIIYFPNRTTFLGLVLLLGIRASIMTHPPPKG